jgi:hypothetical protein
VYARERWIGCCVPRVRLNEWIEKINLKNEELNFSKI